MQLFTLGLGHIVLAEDRFPTRSTDLTNLGKGIYVEEGVRMTSGGIALPINPGAQFNLITDSIQSIINQTERTITGRTDMSYSPDLPRHIEAEDALFPIGILARRLLPQNEKIAELNLRWGAYSRTNLDITISLDKIERQANGDSSAIRGTLETTAGRRLYLRAYTNDQEMRCQGGGNIIVNRLTNGVAIDNDVIINERRLELSCELNTDWESAAYLKNAGDGTIASTVYACACQLAATATTRGLLFKAEDDFKLWALEKMSLPTAEKLCAGSRLAVRYSLPSGAAASEHGYIKLPVDFFITHGGETISSGRMVWAVKADDRRFCIEIPQVLEDGIWGAASLYTRRDAN